MGLIENIQKKSREEKIRIIWIIVILAAVLLVSLWILSVKFYQPNQKDTTFFDSIESGVSDVKDNYNKQ